MIVQLQDTKGARHFHRVLMSAFPKWQSLGWSLVYHDETSPSLAQQGMSSVLIEWSGNGEPQVP